MSNARGKLKIGDDWNAICVIELSLHAEANLKPG
jgi:hypothetical protein